MIVKFCCSVHISEYFNKRIPLSLQQQLILWAVVKPGMHFNLPVLVFQHAFACFLYWISTTQNLLYWL